jgi:hypothetical protein
MACMLQSTEHLSYLIICYTSIGSGIVTIILCVMPGLMEPLSRKIMIHISINCILNSLFCILSYYAVGSFCLFVSYFKSCLIQPAVIWAALIAKILDDSFVKKITFNPKIFLYCCFLNYFVIPVLLLLPFITNSYVDTNRNCTGFTLDNFGIMWRFLLIYFPCYLITFKVIFYYVRIYKHLRKLDTFSHFALLVNRGLIYSFYCLAIFSMFSIGRTIHIFCLNCFSFFPVFVASCLLYFQGIFNLSITLMRNDIRDGLINLIKPAERLESEGNYIDQILKPPSLN